MFYFNQAIDSFGEWWDNTEYTSSLLAMQQIALLHFLLITIWTLNANRFSPKQTDLWDYLTTINISILKILG